MVAVICPWDFPVKFGLGRMLPALLQGYCVIIKPSPVYAILYTEDCGTGKAHLPPGVWYRSWEGTIVSDRHGWTIPESMKYLLPGLRRHLFLQVVTNSICETESLD